MNERLHGIARAAGQPTRVLPGVDESGQDMGLLIVAAGLCRQRGDTHGRLVMPGGAWCGEGSLPPAP